MAIHKKNKILGFSLTDRINEDLADSVMKYSVRIQNAAINYQGGIGKKTLLKLNAGYRKLNLSDTIFKNKYANEDFFTGRFEVNFSKLKDFVSGNIYYQTQSGREQQRQYTYFEVPAGQGFFTWVDFNADGIQQVNEFQETPFKDQARFVRLLVPTGIYIKAQSSEFNGNITIHPGISNADRKVKFYNRTTWNYSGKSTESKLISRTVPFAFDLRESGILAANSFIRNLMEAEIFNDRILIQYTWQNRQNKIFFTNGFDIRQTNTNLGFFRINGGQRWQFKGNLEQRESRFSSEFLPLNNFTYNMNGAEPVVTWQYNSRFRISASFKGGNYRNDTLQIANLTEAGLQLTKALGKGGILDFRVTSLYAKYNLAMGTPLAYDVLQGFNQGRNFRAIAEVRFSASRNIQIFISYEGRKTGDAKFIHIGRAEARYLF